MKRSLIQLFMSLTLSGSLVACLIPFDQELQHPGGVVVVAGQISNLSSQTFVRVGKTADEDRLPIPENDARVFLHDKNGNVYEFTRSAIDTLGLYELPNHAGSPGNIYFIEVLLSDGRVYRSLPEQMASSAGTQELNYSIQNEVYLDNEGDQISQTFLHLFSTTQLAESAPSKFIRWQTEELYLIVPTDPPDPFGYTPPTCYVNQHADPQRTVIFNSTNNSSSVIPNQLVAKRKIDKAFFYQIVFSVYLQSISEAAFSYWEKVNVLNNQVGTIFDLPPARISGNIYRVGKPDEEVAGFFGATFEQVQRLYLSRSNLSFLLTPYCDFDSFRNPITNPYPYECLDCLSVRNSSYRKPDWF